jgi:hypothetical protein
MRNTRKKFMSNTKIDGNGSKHRVRDNNKTRRTLKPAYTATHGNATVEVTPGEKQERRITNQEYERRKAAAIEADRPEFEGTSTDRVERLLDRLSPNDTEFEALVGELQHNLEHEQVRGGRSPNQSRWRGPIRSQNS